MSLNIYNKKRKFDKTSEPKGTKSKSKESKLVFIVQKHDATNLHYDLRLEMEGVMKSWAVPKGPSLDPEVKRLAMQVEDHPISYNKFEGHIPEGNYGAGDVIVWDKGTYQSEEKLDKKKSQSIFIEGLRKGHLKFILKGKKLKGGFALFRFKNENQWMLVKHKDQYATKDDVTSDPRSVISNKILIGRNEDTKKYKDLIKKYAKISKN